jgi:hypothetical protein
MFEIIKQIRWNFHRGFSFIIFYHFFLFHIHVFLYALLYLYMLWHIDLLPYRYIIYMHGYISSCLSI